MPMPAKWIPITNQLALLGILTAKMERGFLKHADMRVLPRGLYPAKALNNRKNRQLMKRANDNRSSG